MVRRHGDRRSETLSDLDRQIRKTRVKSARSKVIVLKPSYSSGISLEEDPCPSIAELYSLLVQTVSRWNPTLSWSNPRSLRSKRVSFWCRRSTCPSILICEDGSAKPNLTQIQSRSVRPWWGRALDALFNLGTRSFLKGRSWLACLVGRSLPSVMARAFERSELTWLRFPRLCTFWECRG